MRRFVGVVVAWMLFAAVTASTANAGAFGAEKDDAQTALNIIPSGQFGDFPVPDGADSQAKMYDGLTPLFDNVKNGDLTTYFKSERFGIDTSGPGTVESVPRPGVTITRDKFDVPHVEANDYDGGIWAAGWIAAEDRGLLLELARHDARVDAIDAPGLSGPDLLINLQDFQPSAQTEAVVGQQTQVLQGAGKEGEAVLHDIDTFTSGINDYLAAHSPGTDPWTRNDIYALNALKDHFFGEGGGDEARRSQFLGGLEQRLGKKKGKSVFNDLRQFKNPGSPTTVDGKFNYGHIPKKSPGSVVLDPGSFQPTPAVADKRLTSHAAQQATHASNELMVDADHSKTGHPLLVGGPQIGYFYPGFTWEIDMHAPGLQWRGATSAPFPGYVLIGRGPDFASFAGTAATGDVIDQFAEKLCGGSDQMYQYKGQCRSMGTFNAGTLNGEPVTFRTTVHGPVAGYATVDGKKVAISSQRSSYGKDVLDQLLFRRLSNGQVHDPRSFFKAASLTPQTFNSFYIDSKHIAEYTSGLLPIRSKKVDPGLPTIGTGQFEWRGFLSDKKHPHGTDPRGGTMVNWNNIAAHGFGAADNNWGGNGSAHRVDLLSHGLHETEKNGKWSLAAVVSAMNAAATQDVRAIDTVPLLGKLLKGSNPPSQRAATMLSLLRSWRKSGGSRLDRDLDGEVDDPGAAIIDTAWPKIADAFMGPRLGSQLDELDSLFTRFEQPPQGQLDGWYSYFDRDIRDLLGKDVRKPFHNSYCGKGKLGACRDAIWQAIDAAGNELAAAQGLDPAAWRANANAERIDFTPVPLTTMRYTNRPSGIQQVISFNKHR